MSFNVAIPLLSLIVAILALVIPVCLQIKSNKREKAREKDRLREQREAKISIETDYEGGFYYLVIKNYGQAQAKNVRIILDDIPISSKCVVNLPEEAVTIFPNGQLKLRIIKKASTCRVCWDDASGVDKSIYSVLSWTRPWPGASNSVGIGEDEDKNKVFDPLTDNF